MTESEALKAGRALSRIIREVVTEVRTRLDKLDKAANAFDRACDLLDLTGQIPLAAPPPVAELAEESPDV